MATATLLLRGDQLGRHTGFSGTGNGPDRVVTVTGVEALDTPDVLFTVLVEQINPGVTQFQNGQFVTITAPDGTVVLPRTGIQPDIEQGLGAGDEHLLISNPQILIDLGGVPVGPTTTTYTIADESAGPGDDDDGNLDFDAFPCFAPDTAVTTPQGDRAVSTLAPGDLICTGDERTVPVRWIGDRRVAFAPGHTAQHPVLLQAGALGPGLPHRDTVVSPDHRILVSGPACDLLFHVSEVLVPAKALTALSGVRRMGGKREMAYVSILTERHEVIFAHGLAAETLYPGPEALRRLTAFEQAAIHGICPGAGPGFPAARRLLTVSEAEALVTVLRAVQQVNPDAALTHQDAVAGPRTHAARA